MHKELIGVQRARLERFDGMANAKFYSELITTGKLKTIKFGSRRYTTEYWCQQCLSTLAQEYLDDRSWKAGVE